MPDERAPEYDDDGPQGEPVERLAGLVVAGPVVGGQETAVLGRQEDLEVGLTLEFLSYKIFQFHISRKILIIW